MYKIVNYLKYLEDQLNIKIYYKIYNNLGFTIIELIDYNYIHVIDHHTKEVQDKMLNELKDYVDKNILFK